MKETTANPTVIYYGAIDPNYIPAFLIRNSLRRGQNTFLVTEGFRQQPSRLKSYCFRQFLNHSAFTILANGDRCADDFRNAGITRPTYRRFGFFEHYPTPDWSAKPSDDGICRILSVGQLIDRKNYLTSIQSLGRLASRIEQSIEYTICGEGNQRLELEAEISRLPENIIVRLPGNQTTKQLETYFQQADIFVMPSKYDGWGVVLNQAIHFHLPIIASEGVRAARGHLVRENDNGFMFNNEQKLDENMLKLIQDSELRLRFARSSAAIAEVWHIDAVASNLVRVLAGQEPIVDDSESPLVKI